MPETPAPRHDGTRPPLHRLLDVLVCPLCGERLEPAGQSLRCTHRHTFDIARQGYLSLLSGGTRVPSADTAAMVGARSAFLGTGHYAPLARSLAAVTAELTPPAGTVLDAGAGTGYYLAAALDAVPDGAGLGLDTSKFALRRAAGAHPRAAAASWDVWRPFPVRTGSVDLLVNVFAPRNGAEFHRVLRPGGALLVLTPTEQHLAELRSALGLLSVDAAKEDRLERSLAGRFTLERRETHECTIALTARDAENLVAMGPNAHHVDARELHARLGEMVQPFPATVSWHLSVYRPRRTEPAQPVGSSPDSAASSRSRTDVAR